MREPAGETATAPARIRVKICGVTSPEAVEAAVEAGADALGFLFADSPRRVSIDRALELSRGVPPFVCRVAVLQRPDPEWAEEVLELFQPDLVQAEAGDRERFGGLPPGRFLPVYRAEPSPAQLEQLPALLFEGRRSGTGDRADWSAAARLARHTRLILAGGLDPECVAEAVATVRPWAVDVSSGVESAPGVKEPEKIRRFIRAVRTCEATT